MKGKGRWVLEQDFHGNFQVNVAWFLAFFNAVRCLLNCAHSGILV